MATITIAEPTACTECGGAGTVEEFSYAVGMRDVRCEAEGCDDGIVR